MPTYARGNLWAHQHDLTCITTNAVTTRAGLVMGAGIAKQAADDHPRLRFLAAHIIRQQPNPRHYGFLPLPNPLAPLALFQTKDHFREPGSLELIQHSLEGLTAYALAHPETRIALPYPGIGMGGLDPATVQPLLQTLPHNVIVWRLR